MGRDAIKLDVERVFRFSGGVVVEVYLLHEGQLALRELWW